MQVIATAGHVDHGKSTLLRALTGMEPDRWEQERRRGLTIDLGFVWLTLPSGEQLAFVDVPGHERFVPNMLAGVGQVPAVLFVVAADEGWMPQSAEHLAAVDALGIRRGVLVITRADLADPAAAMAQARAEIGRSSLGAVPAVAVSAVTGSGLPELLTALDKLAHSLPVPDPSGPVRLWVDRAFSMTGSGTVVTGTLPAGTIHQGDELVVTPSMRPVRVREIQSLGERVPAASGLARVALNLRGVSKDGLSRGMALVQAGRWQLTDLIDVRICASGLQPAAVGAAGHGLLAPGGDRSGDHGDHGGDHGAPDDGHDAALAGGAVTAAAGGAAPHGTRVNDAVARLGRSVHVHVGAARTVGRVRPLGGDLARLALRDPLPLHVGDRLLLRDPGAARPGGPPAGLPDSPAAPGPGLHAAGAPAACRAAWPAATGALVLDVAPPSLTRRGAATAAAKLLASWPDQPSAADLLRRHGLVRASALLAMGIREHPDPVAGEWLADPAYWSELAQALGAAVAAHAAREPLAIGLPLEAARAALGLPDRRLVTALVRPPFRICDGAVQIMPPAGPAARSGLPEALEAAVRVVRADLAAVPFVAPDAERLRQLGLDLRGIAAAAKAGLLLRISDQIVLAPGADDAAAAILAGLPQPFTAADARQALGTTRRIAIPLLEYLDRAGITERLPDDRRRVRAAAG
ncbi:MAG: selenocysteine-specific translation elongation factor [Streptosporangiaceae bacterium]|jgi:selenocysteine-specific elongation factor